MSPDKIRAATDSFWAGTSRALVPARTQTQQITAIDARAGRFHARARPYQEQRGGTLVVRNGCRRALDPNPQGGQQLRV